MALKNRQDYGGSVYDQQYFTDAELAGAAAARESAQAGETSWDSAHDYVESIRKNYGYSGGEDGSGYVALSDGYSYTGARPTYESTAEKPTYTDKYADQISALTDSILNRGEFTYDYESDPVYQAYAREYTQRGRQAMEDTLGQVSARTGGMASSYAGTAAQQAYNGYMDELSGIIPELYSAAYDRYYNELVSDENKLGLLQGLSDSDYSRYADALSQYNADRSFDYGLYADALEQYNADRSFDYGQYADQRSYALTRRSQDAGNGWSALSSGMMPGDTQLEAMGITASQAQQMLSKAETSQAYSRLAAEITSYGYQPGSEELSAAGMTQGEYQAMYNSWYRNSYLAAASGSGSGGSGSSSGSSSGSGAQDYDGLYAAAWASGNPQSYIANNYKSYGFTSSSGLYNDYKTWTQTPVSSTVGAIYQGSFETLVNYTKRCMEQAGRSAAYMQDTLKKQGYSDAVIDRVFAALGQ